MKTLWGIVCLIALALWCAPRTAFGFLCIEPLPPSVTYSPGALDFGSTSKDVPKTLSVVVTYHSQRQFYQGACICRCSQPSSATITMSSSLPLNFSASPANFTLAEEGSQTVQITLNPRNVTGTFSGNVVAGFSAGSQTFPLSVSGVSYAGQSNINVTPTNLDFGLTEIGASKTRQVVLSNLGTATLSGTIATAAPFSSPSTNFSIGPGLSVNVNVQFAPTSAGPAAGIFQINSNDPDAGNLPLALTGLGAAPALIVSPSSLDFGTIPVGESLSKTVKISNASCSSCPDALTLDLSAFQCSKPEFTVAPPSDASLAPGESASIQVTFTPTSNSQKNATLTFHTTDPLYPTKTIDMTADAEATSIDPSTMNLSFGGTHLGTTATQVLSIHNKGSAPLTVSSIASSSSRVTATPSNFGLAAGATQTVQVRYTPSAATALNLTTEVLNGTLTVNSNDSNLPQMVLDMAGHATSPLISAMPLDFGTVYMNAPLTGVLNVKNDGNETLSVTNVSSNNAAITPLETSFTVPAGNAHSLPVRYNPSAAGGQSATLTTASNDYFAPTIGIGVTGTAVPELDLSADHLEVTQAIQDADNSLDLVAGKTTVVRTFIGSTIRGAANVSNTLRNIDGLLHVKRNGTEITGSPLKSSNGPIAVVPHPDRNKANDTLNFVIPGGWLAGNDADHWTFTVDVNPASGARVPRVMESSYANNGGSQTATLWNNYKPSIFYIPVSLQGRPLPLESKMASGADLLKKIFPVASVNYVRRPPIAFNGDVNLTDQFLKLSSQLFYASHLGVSTPPDRTYGWISEQAESLMKYLGIAEDIPGRVAYGGGLSNPAVGQEVFAHEIGHTYGLCHTHRLDSCPSGYSDGHVLDDGAILETGFDVDSGAPVPAVSSGTYLSCCAQVTCSDGRSYKDCAGYPIPQGCTASYPSGANCAGQGAIDFMAYKQNPGQKAWINPKRYESLFISLRSRESDPSNARGCNTNSTICGQPALLVAGSIHSNDDGMSSLHPLFEAQAVPDQPEDADTAYAVHGIDAAGGVLFSYPLVLGEQTSFQGEKSGGSAFSIVVPNDPDLRSIQIVRDGSVLVQRTKSEHTPTLVLTSPAGGTSVDGLLDVSWQGFDEDGDFLSYSVLYSRDGGRLFQAIGVDLYNSGFLYDASQLPGSDAAVVRVVASDGFHTTTADSPSFRVSSKPPRLQIATPRDGETVFSGVPLSLEAITSDPEDGDLPANAVHWSSDAAGDLGSGSPLVVSLNPGTHTLTAQVADSEGHGTAESVTIRIVDGAQAPHADAGEDQIVSEGDAVVLDASATDDPNEGDTLAYDWTQIEGPEVLLDDPTSAQPVFTAPSVASDALARFLLTVTDNSGNVATDFVDITILNIHFASLKISETGLDFGTAEVGESVRRSFTVSNTGDEKLRISLLRISRGVFEASAPALSIDPGNSSEFSVAFRPDEKATYEGSLWIESNSAGGVPKTVVLKGTTPQPEKFYNDNGPGGSLLPEGYDVSPSPDWIPNSDVGSASGAAGCGLTKQ